jgi:hypothetical protein
MYSGLVKLSKRLIAIGEALSANPETVRSLGVSIMALGVSIMEGARVLDTIKFDESWGSMIAEQSGDKEYEQLHADSELIHNRTWDEWIDSAKQSLTTVTDRSE